MQYSKNLNAFVSAVLSLTWVETESGTWLFVASGDELAVIDSLFADSPSLADQAIAWQEDRLLRLESDFEVAKATFEVRCGGLSPLAAEYREEEQQWAMAKAAAELRHDRLSEELELLKAFATTLK